MTGSNGKAVGDDVGENDDDGDKEGISVVIFLKNVILFILFSIVTQNAYSFFSRLVLLPRCDFCNHKNVPVSCNDSEYQ